MKTSWADIPWDGYSRQNNALANFWSGYSEVVTIGYNQKKFFFSKWSFFGNILGKVFIGTTGKLFEKVEQNLPFVGYLLKESTLGTILL